MPETPTHNLESVLTPESKTRLNNLEIQILKLTNGERIPEDQEKIKEILGKLPVDDQERLVLLLETYHKVVRGEKPKYTREEISSNVDLSNLDDSIISAIKEGRATLMEVTIGDKTEVQLIKELKQNNIFISTYAGYMLNSPGFNTQSNEEHLDLVKLSLKDLGLNEGVNTREIYAKAKKLGLDICPAEVGPHLRLQYMDQPHDDWLRVAMKPIAGRDGKPLLMCIFFLGQRDGLRLSGYVGGLNDDKWGLDNQFVFRIC